MKKIIFAFVLILSCFTFNAESRGRARFIFLFIGDGFGPNQYLAAEKAGVVNNMSMLPVKSKISTRSHGGAVTDSAAAATAIATGVKTKNGMVGLDHTGKRLESILEMAKSNGIKVGVISSMTLNHATPAAFYAHISTRRDYYSIGTQLIKSNFDYFGGGGFTHERGRKKDKESLFALAEAAGYKIFRKGAVPNPNEVAGQRVISVNPYLRSDACMHYVEKKPAKARPLSAFVDEAIKIFGEHSFIIVVEGGNIDYACHDHEYGRMLAEIDDFDKAIAPALEFYSHHPNETLIIVTADHETGGLSLEPSVKWSTKGHSGVEVPIFANIKLDKVKDNTDIAKLIFAEIN